MIPKPQAHEIKRFTLVGVCGVAGSGKNTVGDILDSAEVRQRVWAVQCSLAAAVKDVVCNVFDLPAYVFTDRAMKEETIQKLGHYSPRTLAQLVGTECFRGVFGEWVWVHHLHNQILNKYAIQDAVVVTDIRFKNEVQWVLEQEGVLVYVDRPNVAPVASPMLAVTNELTHASERIPTLEDCQQMVDTYGGTVVYIKNDGSLLELKQAVIKQVVPLLEPVSY